MNLKTRAAFQPRYLVSAILLLPLAAIVMSNCRTRLSNAQLESTQSGSAGLDVMDVAVLYPPPGGNEIHEWAKALFSQRPEEWGGQDKEYAHDQAILDNLSARGFWPKVFSDNLQLMPRLIFDSIIETAQGRPPDSRGIGIDYQLKARTSEKTTSETNKTGYYNLEANMAEPDRWRVSSFRFDPCPYSVAHGLPSKEDDNASGAPTATMVGRSKLCQAEFRLVVQPFLGRNRFETAMGATIPFISMSPTTNTGRAVGDILGRGRGWFAADYAIHLFYRLTREEALRMAGQLLDLRSRYQSICPTVGVPAQVHPCLVYEALSLDNKQNVSFASDLLAIYGAYVGGLHKAAVWGSQRNATPWMFFVGNVKKSAVKEPEFEVSRIKPLDSFSFENEDDRKNRQTEASSSNSSNAKLAAEKAEKLANASLLTERKAMMLDRNTGVTRSAPTNILKRRINPPPLPLNDSLAVFVMGNVGFQSPDAYKTIVDKSNYRVGLGSVDTSRGSRYSHVIQVTSRIENPILNNEFRVDCASCHMANMEASHARMMLRRNMRNVSRLSENVPFLNIYQAVIKDSPAANTPDGSSPWEKAFYPKDYYQAPPGYSAFRTSSSTVSPKGKRAMVYILNQFSFYAEQPIVSARVLNEAADSADFANRFLINREAPLQLHCDRNLLDVCLTGMDGKLMERGDWAVKMDLPKETYDWYASFVASKQCLAPEAKICTAR